VLRDFRDITATTLLSYLPSEGSNLPSVIKIKKKKAILVPERDILYKVFDMKRLK
jgi:hypothetical protein